MKKQDLEKKLCIICGKKSDEDICQVCKEKIQAEAFYKKKKIEKEEKG